jgi:hypothetical protein
MSSQNFIEPSAQTVTNLITSFVVNVTDIQLFTSATLIVDLYNSDPRLINKVNLSLAGEDYQNWANNDQYIIDYVATKLGFVMAPVEPVVPDEPVAQVEQFVPI